MTKETWKAFDGLLKTKYPKEYRQAQVNLNAKLLCEVAAGAIQRLNENFNSMPEEAKQEILDIIEEQWQEEKKES